MLDNKNQEEKNDIMYFDNDNEFVDFCIDPDIVLHKNDQYNLFYYDIQFTPEYLKCVKDGKKFCIRDQKSKVCKHKGVTYKLVFKPVENLIDYNDMIEHI